MKYMNPIANQLEAYHRHPRRRAFTLIELLVVITIIAVLAALTLVGLNKVGALKKIQTAQAEMKEIQTAIENYHAHYGTYPPGNSDGTTAAALTNQLYYELTGVTTNATPSGPGYQAIDNDSIAISDYTTVFGVAGVLNCTRTGGETPKPAVNFLTGLKPNRIGPATFYGKSVDMLVTSVGGPDDAYAPIGVKGANPFRYKAPSPTNNNADSYDLWVQLSLGATNFSGANNGANRRLICNWTSVVQKNSPLP